jgi:hypothetical protein
LGVKVQELTEQETIITFVLPFLRSIGFDRREIRAEQSFTLQLGHYTYRVDTKEQVRLAAPRLDILLTRNGKNLFVVEVKRDGLPLTDRDRDQAVSYARVIHPVAPFVILTNGSTTKLFDTLSREEISPSDFVVRDDYELSLTLEQDHEFFHDFVGYSAENVCIFSRAQIEARTRPLVGGITDRTAKYIAELYEPRVQLETSLRRFVASESPGFVVLGDSGTGKTSALCHLALTLTKRGSLCFFYRAFELTGDLLSAIAFDFNWTFSQQQSEAELIRRLKALSKDKPIVFVLDAVDEWIFPGRVQSLLNLLSRLPGKTIKLAISCKTAAWSQFVTHRGTSTGLEEFLYVHNKKPFFSLSAMDKKEFHRAYRKYKEAFSFGGYFEDHLLREMESNPFLMRIAFEVAAKRKDKRLILSNRDLFDSYYQASLAKIGVRDHERWSAQEILDKLAECIFDSNQASVPKTMLVRAMGGGMEYSALAELVEFNIIELASEEEEERVGFYFSKLRDYIISFRLRRWHAVTAVTFSEEISRLRSEGVHQDVLLFFYPLAEEQKKEFIDGPLRQRAGEYLDLYTRIVEEHFAAIRRRFAPFTLGMIGFLGELIIPRRDIGYFGFRKIKDDDERVFLLPYSQFELSSNLPSLYGGQGMHSFDIHFLDLDLRRTVIDRYIREQLDSIVRKGLLDESQNHDLLAEIVPAMVYDKRGMFKIYGSPLFRNLFPLDLEKMAEGLRRSELEDYFLEQKVEEKTAKGELRENGYSYPDDFSAGDLRSIEDQVEAAMRRGQKAVFAWGRTPADQIVSRFEEAKAGLNTFGTSVIETPVINLDFLDSVYGRPTSTTDFIREQFTSLYAKMIQNYKIIVERNFPALCSFFELYSCFPAKFFINIEKPHYYDRDEYEVTVFICRNDGPENEVIYISRDEVSSEAVWRRELTLVYRGRSFEVITRSRGPLRGALFADKHVDFSLSSGRMPLRGMIYSRIKKELPAVMGRLAKLYPAA